MANPKVTTNTPDEEFDPAAGGMVPVGPRRSFKKSSTTGHHGVVKIDGFSVWHREPTVADVDLLTEADNIFSSEMQRISKGESPGRAPQTGKPTAPKLTPSEAKEQSLAAIKARKIAYYEVLKSVLVKWNLPDDAEGSILPFTPEAIDDLPFTAAHEIVSKIQFSSTIGGDQAAFLGET